VRYGRIGVAQTLLSVLVKLGTIEQTRATDPAATTETTIRH